jgi:DNA modification methylase
MKVKNQHHTEKYSVYNGDCVEVVSSLENNSIDFSVYSPPFAGLYEYSSDIHDMSNCETKEDFLNQYEFLIKEMARITKPGRLTAVHCQDVLTNVTKNFLWDFPHEIIMLHEKHGFHFCNRITVWKEPLKVRLRTMVRSLMHKLIVEDSTECFTAQPDYVLIFKKSGENKVPVTHEHGLNVYPYFGANPISPETYRSLKNMPVKLDAMGTDIDDYDKVWSNLLKKYENFTGDHKENKASHIMWRRYASSVWDDIRNEVVLPFKDSKEEDDEKHVHALQLDVIDRLVVLYTNPGEVVLTPFMGVGSEVYSPVSLDRKAIGIELKDSYYKQALLNLKKAPTRFDGLKKQLTIL